MHDEPYRLTADHVRAINRAESEAQGTDFVVLNNAYVEGACARPLNLWHYEGERDLVSLAVSLLFAVAQNHAFLDGNKRPGFYAAVAFLQANRVAVPTLDTVQLAEMMISVIEHAIPVQQFEDVFRADLESIDRPM